MKNKIILTFQKKFPELYQKMGEVSHNISSKEINPFHAEGTVLTHTLMVMTWIDTRSLSNKDKKLLLVVGMLHDIGKVYTQEIKEPNNNLPKRYSFNGHEGMSTMISTDILKNLKDDLELSLKDIKDILYLISTHGVYIDEDCYLEDLRIEFRLADKNGAVRNVDENIFSQYAKRKYSIKSEPKKDKECIILTGLPCSGKSTYRKTLEEKGYKIISRDDLILEYTGISKYNKAYNTIHSSEDELKKFENYFYKIVNSYSKYDKICIDMTMLSLSSRRKMMNRFKGFEFYSKVFLTDLAIILKRNKLRPNKTIPLQVLEGMSKSFVIPVKEEGFKDIEIFI